MHFTFLGQVLQERLGVNCMLGLTATATKTTAVSVAQHLQIDDFAAGTIRGATVPDNLLLSVSRDEDRDGVSTTFPVICTTSLYMQ